MQLCRASCCLLGLGFALWGLCVALWALGEGNQSGQCREEEYRRPQGVQAQCGQARGGSPLAGNSKCWRKVCMPLLSLPVACTPSLAHCSIAPHVVFTLMFLDALPKIQKQYGL